MTIEEIRAMLTAVTGDSHVPVYLQPILAAIIDKLEELEDAID